MNTTYLKLNSVKNVFFTSFFLMIVVFSSSNKAAIDITVDVTGAENKGSTLSKKVFIERVELSFPNKRPSQSVSQFSKGFYARARFKYLGNGPLTVRWMVDGHVVSQITEILSFGKEVDIRSDKNNVALPTFTQGSHKVDIQFINSSGVIDVATKSINYFVTDGVAEFQEDGVLKILYPKDRSVDPFNFYFRWQGFKAIKAYQLEVESIADKSKKSQNLIKALSKVDVYSPTDLQRLELSKGEYRWRVSGLYKQKGLKPLQSQWAHFTVSDDAVKGGVYIVSMNTQKVKEKPSSLFEIKQTQIQSNELITQSQSLLSKSQILGGDDYHLGIQLQNSGLKAHNNLMLEVTGTKGLIGQYPIEVSPNSNAVMTIPLKMESVSSEQYQNLTLRIIDGIEEVDQAALNLTIEPKVDINGLDFVELDRITIVSEPLSFCGKQPRNNSIFSSMVSSVAIDTSNKDNPKYERVDLNPNGYFSFAQGQKVQFAAFLKDKGLASWLATNCPVGLVDKPNQTLSFIAYKVDESGNVETTGIELGQVVLDETFIEGFEDIVVGSEATIPTTGQYKISLNNISHPVDLFATRKKQLPQFIHASGFTFEVVSLSSDSVINTTVTPHQATLSGIVKTTWKNDSNETELRFNVNDITVNMVQNPIHADLVSGQIELQESADLSLFGVDFKLNQLVINEHEALAQLSYQLSSDYREELESAASNKLVNPLINSSSSYLITDSLFNQTGASSPYKLSSVSQNTFKNKGDNLASISSVNALGAVQEVSTSEQIILNDIPIFNGGEFIARHQFSYDRKDVSLLGSRLALRLNQAEFIADLSESANYNDYTQQAQFMGVGFYGATLRLKVSQDNGLFAVSSENPFIYAKANWLQIGATGLFGEDIEVLSQQSVADFFNQKPAESLALVSPFGFDLNITGGTFGLASSEVTGINFKGTVTLPNNEDTLAVSNYPLNFDHLEREGDHFSALINDDEYHIRMGVFNYQPERLVLRIGENNSAINNDTEPVEKNNPNQQAIDTWLNSLDFDTNAGLQLSGGSLEKGWDLLSENVIQNLSHGKFLLTATGLTGQWFSYQADNQSSEHYEINGFDTSLSSYWLKFDDSQLSDSYNQGTLHIPYPTKVDFSFTGLINQEAGLDIEHDGLHLVAPQNQGVGFVNNGLPFESRQTRLSDLPTKIALDYWHAELEHPIQSAQKANQYIFYDAENSRILLDDFLLHLNVADDLGGDEFFAKGGKPAFKVSTYLLPNGQLDDTQASANIDSSGSSIRFLGQPFSLNTIEFLPYVGDGQPPENDEVGLATPLVKVTGSVGFSVFGLQYSEINHTALGARVPVISPEFGISDESGDGYFGDDEGLIKVFADLKFSNTYSLDSETVSTTIGAVSDTPVNAPQPYKAFVGEAELVLINAFSMKGLAEAGLHLEQDFPDANGIWQDGSNEMAYERIGLGLGVDVLKAAIAGQEAFDNAARLGEAGITLVTGAEGIEKEVIELGAESIALLESVAVAVTLRTPNAILHAVDNGFSTADKGIDLLQEICVAGDVSCTPAINSILELSSIMLRGAGIAVEYPNVDAKKVASVSLQTMDAAIPVLKKINPDELFNNNSGVTLNDKHQAALSLAHSQVIAARSLIDHDGKIPFQDFTRISNSYLESVEAVAKITEINSLLTDAGVKPVLELSVALAKESITMAQDIKNNPSPQKLATLAKDYVGLLCQQSKRLMPLLPTELRQTDDLLEPVMGVSSLILDQLSQTQMPENPQMAMQFLRSVLQALSRDQAGAAACGGNGLVLPEVAKAMLNMAAHSLQPLTGELKTVEDQVTWALEGTKLSIVVMQPLAQSAELNTSAISPINQVLDNLIQTFSQLDSGLNSDENIANGQRVLRMAAGIPNAFNELIKSSGAYQASELMNVYVVVMTELDGLLNHANELAQGNASNVDLLELPIKLLEQTQALSFIGQNEKLNLANVSHILDMSREVTSEKPKLTKVMANVRSVHANIQVLGGSDESNPANKREVEQAIALLDLLAGLADDNQQLSRLLIDAISDLIPLLVINPTLFSADEIDRFIKSIHIAFPVVDFNQTDRKETLDDVLPELLKQAEEETNDPDVKEKIKQAQTILAAKDHEFVGFIVRYKQENGIDVEKDLPISAKEVAADGSIRELFFREHLAKHEYDSFNTSYTRGASIIPNGGLKETTTIELPDGFNFTQLDEANKTTLFNDYWTDLIHSGQFIRREYVVAKKEEDNSAHDIVIERQQDGQFEANIVSTKEFYGFKYQHKIRFLNMPEGIDYPNNHELDEQINNDGKVISAAFFKNPIRDEFPACEYEFGCVYVAQSGSNQLTLLSNTDEHSKAVYESPNSPIYRSLDDIEFSSNGTGLFSSPTLLSYEGFIKSASAGWNNEWQVNYKNNRLTLMEGQSSEHIEIPNGTSSLQDLVEKVIQSTQFEQRRVINGSIVWDYNMHTHNALKTDDVGNWWLYKMPENLMSLLVPQPNQVLDIAANSFILQAQKVNGVSESFGGLALGDNGEVELPAGDPNDNITIGPNGDVWVGGEPINTPQDGKKPTNREYQPDGGSKTTYDDGSTKTVLYPDSGEGVNPKNLETVRKETPKLGADGKPSSTGRRISSTIKYCKDKTKSFAECPAADKFEETFNYDATPSFIKSDNTCGAISPVSGVNQELKHQLWVQFFRMEADLYANPTETGLNELLNFSNQAVEQGIDVDEMKQQYTCVFEKIGNKILASLFDELEAGADNVQKLDEWNTNPSESPFNKMQDLLDKLFTLNPNESLPDFSDYIERTKEVKTRIIRKRLFDIPDIESIDESSSGLSEAGNETFDKLAKYLREFLDLEALKASIGDESTSSSFADVCVTFNRVVGDLYQKYSIESGQAQQMTEADIQLILKFEANKGLLGCDGNSVLSELAELASNAGLDAGLTAALGADINTENDLNFKFNLLFKKVTKAIEGNAETGYETESQLRQAYLEKLMSFEFVSQFLTEKSNETDLLIDHIFKLQRLIQLINSDVNVSSNFPNIITDDEFVVLQTDVVNGLKNQWKTQWDAAYAELLDALNNKPNQLINALNDLGTLYEQAKLLNHKMNVTFIEEDKREVVTIDPDLFLKVSVLGETSDVINELIMHQQNLKNSFWLQVLDQSELSDILKSINANEDAVKWILKTAKQGKTGSFSTIDTLIESEIPTYFSQVKNQIANFSINEEAEVDTILLSGSQLLDLFNSIALPKAKVIFKTEINTLITQVNNNIRESNVDIQSYKLLAIDRVYKGNETTHEDITETDIATTNQLLESLQQKIDTPAKLNALATSRIQETVKKIIELMERTAAQGGDVSSGFAELKVPLTFIVNRELENLASNSDLKDFSKVIDVMFDLQIAGGSADSMAEIGEIVLPKSRAIQNSILSCKASHTCTKNHFNQWIKLFEFEASFSEENTFDLSEYDAMKNSSPNTWDASLQFDYSKSSLQKRVEIHVGRQIVSAEFDRLIHSLDIDLEADRAVMRGLVKDLEELEKVVLSNGHVYALNDANDRDPLLDVLEPLRGTLYSWLADKQDEIEAYLEQNPDQLTAKNSVLSHQFGVSETEINSVILPAINNTKPMQPHSGDRYKDAADVLKGINNKKDALKVSFNLLSHVPNPEFSSEHEVFSASVGVMSQHIADKLVGDTEASALIVPSEQQMMLAMEQLIQQQPDTLLGMLSSNQGQMMNVSMVNLPLMYDSLLEQIIDVQNGTGDLSELKGKFKTLFRDLLLLPSKDSPISELSGLLKTEFLQPLLGDLNCQADNGESINPFNCVLGTGLNLASLSLDSVIQTQQTNNSETKDSLGFIKTMAEGLERLVDSDQADEFWLGLAAKSVSLTLNSYSESTAINNTNQASQFVTTMVSNGLDFSITLLQSEFVNDVIPLAVQPVKDFMLSGSELFAQKMQQSSDDGFAFPILLAQITSDFIFAEMEKTALSPLVPVAQTVSDWNLAFIGNDTNWPLLLNAIDNPNAFDPTLLLTSLVSSGGLGKLSCDLNLLMPSDIPKIPPSLVLSPFVAVNELLNLTDKDGNVVNINAVPQNERALFLIDVAAGLSNLWSAPMSCHGVSDDQRLATLLRQFKKVDLSNGEIAAISTVGNLGLGALHALVPNEPVLDAFDIAWNGLDDSYGIDDALKLGMSASNEDSATNALNFLEFTSKVPTTMLASVEALNNANSPTANLLRLVTGNVQQSDLLAPDKLLGGDNQTLEQRIKYAIPNGFLASIGMIRKSLTPNHEVFSNNDNDYYVTNDPYGFLKMNPITAVESPQLLFLLTADHARNGMSSLKELLEGFEKENRLNTINERAMFSELTGTAVGFSGVSGGLQREWSKDWSDDNNFGDLEVQAYGNFTIPLVVDSAVLMTYTSQNLNDVITFYSTAEGAVSGIGLASDFTGYLSVGSDGLGLSYDGDLGLEFMMRPLWRVATSGYVSNFDFPSSSDITDPIDYALEQATNINVGMCAEAASSVVPAPLSILLGTDFQLNGGLFAQKNGSDLLAGSRVGLTGTMNVPGFTGPFALVPIGLNLSGNFTGAYQGTFEPTERVASLEYQACTSAEISLNFFGEVISLADAVVQVAAFTQGEDNQLTTGLKFKIGAGSTTSNNTTNASNGLKQLLKCNDGGDPLKVATCTVISAAQLDTLWGVIEVSGSIEGPITQTLIMGVGKDFPEDKEDQLMFDPKLLTNPSATVVEEVGDFIGSLVDLSQPIDLPDLTPLGIKKAGAWGGWPDVGVIPNLCQANLCEGSVPAIGGN